MSDQTSTPDTGKTPEGKGDGNTQEQPKEKDDFLSVVNEVLKREFTTRDEAVKSLENLNSMVGDNAIAELRKKATDADHFSALVQAVAADNKVTPEQAKEHVLSTLKEFKPKPVMENTTNQQTPEAGGSSNPELEKQVQELLQARQKEELLRKYPDAEHVMSDVELMSKASGKSLLETFEGSSFKDVASKVKEKAEEPASSPDSKSRLSSPDDSTKEIIDRIQKTGSQVAREELVKTILGEKLGIGRK